VNTVAGFARNADGTLTALPGSPFAIGGAGTGAAIGTQGALQLSGDGRYLLAADAASNEIVVLRIKPDGALQQAEGSPISSNGSTPASIAVHGTLVYVANTGNGGANYTGFTLNAGGHLRPIPGSTVALPDNASVGNLAFNATGTHLIGTRKGTTQIDSFLVDHAGLLHAAPGSPFAATAGTFAGAFRPTNPAQLFVANTQGGGNPAGNSSLSAYAAAANGALAAIDGPVGNGQRGSCWIALTPDGQYAFTSNAGSDTISRYALAADGTATLLGSTPLQGLDLHPFDLSVDPSGQYLYVNEVDHLSVGVLRINEDGSLSELAGSRVALPAGAAPFGLAVAVR
jgi:6-phosphogluconolactonase (cycloisomerase 2 family)